MSQDLIAKLEEIALTRIKPDAQHPQVRLAFETVAALQSPTGAPTGLGDLRGGFGVAPTAALASKFPGDAGVAGATAGNAVWFAAGMEESETDASASVWIASFSQEEVFLAGVHPLTSIGAGLEAPGLLTFTNAPTLRVAAHLRKGVLQNLVVALAGSLKVDAALGPFDLGEGAGTPGTYRLEVRTHTASVGGSLLTDPAAILDSGFDGRLSISVATSTPISVLDATFSGTQAIQIEAEVTSGSGTRGLTLGRLSYSHDVAGSVSIGGDAAVTLDQLSLKGTVSRWTPAGGLFEFSGTAKASLPSDLADVTPSTATTLDASVDFVHDSSSAVSRSKLGVEIESLVLSEEVNLLGLSGRDIRLEWETASNADWTMRFSGLVRQSWRRVAESVEQLAGITMPAGERMPDALASWHSEFGGETSAPASVDVELALVEPTPGVDTPPIPYSGRSPTCRCMSPTRS